MNGEKVCDKHPPTLAQLVEHSTVVVFQCYRNVAGSIPASRKRGLNKTPIFQYAYSRAY